MTPLINIGRGQRQLRMLSAIGFVTVALLYAIAVVALGLDPLWRLLVFFRSSPQQVVIWKRAPVHV